MGHTMTGLACLPQKRGLTLVKLSVTIKMMNGKNIVPYSPYIVDQARNRRKHKYKLN
ncbi:hypothetical protein SESBI_47167 [Sesbania bispinosa]|nr:hypothetical protein SESBI_47167 [Sesbania bispinosa]